MGVSYNLIDQPWIPCLYLDGTYKEVSLRDVLCDAATIREVYDDSPLVTVSLHRLLLAILHRVFGPETKREWLGLWNTGAFDLDRLEGYLTRWRDRFDLFGEQRPFYQVPGRSTGPPRPANWIVAELASAHNVMLFDHTSDAATHALTASEAARALLAFQNFSPAGGVSFAWTANGKERRRPNRANAPLTWGMALLVCGDTLFETLLCNLSQCREEDLGVPCWEQQDPFSLLDYPQPRGRLDLYTWQSRLVHLEGANSEDGQAPVLRVHLAQGRALDKAYIDPMKSYVAVKEKGEVPLGFRLDHALWRDSEALLKLAGEHGRPAACLAWVTRMVRDGEVPMDRRFRVSAYGTLPKSPMQPANVILWRHERMPVPARYLGDPDRVAVLAEAVRRSEDAARRLDYASRTLAARFLKPEAPEPIDKRELHGPEVTDLVESLAPGRSYWSGLDGPFRNLLLRVAADADLAVLGEWNEALRAQYRTAFAGAAKALGTTDRAIRAVAQTEGLAEHLIRELIPEEVTHGE